MPAKKVTRVMIIRAEGGGANPAKLGQKLGPFGIGGKFCQQFNLKTADRKGEVVPCVLTIYEDRTFDRSFKTTPVTYLLLKAAGVEKAVRVRIMAETAKMLSAVSNVKTSRRLPNTRGQILTSIP